jgi:hypothetical protein
MIANWPFGFAKVRCELGKELVAGNSGRGREAGFLVDACPDFLGRLPRSRYASQIVGYIEIGFIERKGLDQRRIIFEDRLNLLGDFAVDVEPWGDKQEFSAFPSSDD